MEIYAFQIRLPIHPICWHKTAVRMRCMEDFAAASDLANRLSRRYNAIVRLGRGITPMSWIGTYFTHEKGCFTKVPNRLEIDWS